MVSLPSASWGSFGAGSQRRDWSDMSVDLSVRTGDQASFRMSRQIAPYTSASTLIWKEKLTLAEEIFGSSVSNTPYIASRLTIHFPNQSATRAQVTKGRDSRYELHLDWLKWVCLWYDDVLAVSFHNHTTSLMTYDFIVSSFIWCIRLIVS
jgi:hypothetical protein